MKEKHIFDRIKLEGGKAKMEYKRVGTIALFIIMAIMITGLASATPTLSINASGATLSGNYTVGFTVTGTGNCSNLTVWGSASDTNITTAVIQATTTLGNTGQHLGVLNSSITNASSAWSTGLEQDSDLWRLYGVCNNNSNTSEPLTSTTVTATLDNYVPPAPTSLSPATGTIDEDGTVTFTASVTANNVTDGWVEFKQANPGKSIYEDPLESGGALSVTIPNMPAGTYEWRYVANDGSDTKPSEYRSLIVETSKGSSSAIFQQQQQLAQEQQDTPAGPVNLKLFVVLLAIVIIGMKFLGKRK